MVEYMLHTLIHLALTKPSNLLLRGKRGRVPVFAHQGRGKISQLLAAGKVKRELLIFLVVLFFLQFQKGDQDFQLPGYTATTVSGKTKTFAKLLSGEKKFDQILSSPCQYRLII